MNAHPINFPQQRVGGAEKDKEYWYQNCIDYIIDAGLSFNDRSTTETTLNILHGEIPNEFYKKTLNPYNTTKEAYKRFPATLRNYDIMSDIIRRYVSEYFKGVHEFVVGANNPEIVLKKNAKLRETIGALAQQAFQQEFEKRWDEMQQQAQQEGTPIEQLNPQDAMPDPEAFVKNFNEKYIDDESKQAQDILDYIRSVTEDNKIYLSAFFNWCALGECYTYTEVSGEEIIKENIPVMEAYPIPTSDYFVEDHDMFARRMLMSYNEIIDKFDTSLTKHDREFLNKHYSEASYGMGTKNQLLYSQYFEHYPDACEKFSKEERTMFKCSPVNIAEQNNNLFEVWHVVWKGEARQGILTYVNEIGLETKRIVEENYKLNKEAGDISIEWVYEPQIYEGYRIGTRYNGVYPIKARPILYGRGDKLPYNGMMEVLPYMGQFSIIKLITPFQILRNIIYYHREMVIAKNKMLILLLPESLIASNSEDKIYKMAADGVLIVDDEEDTTGQKMAQVRMLNANMNQYVSELTALIDSIKADAWETVDMNAQRYGEIAQSAGMTTTQEAIARSSMGSIIIVAMFDEMRKHDYQRDLDYAKLAYVDGLQRTFFDDKNERRYLSLDVNSFINSDYGVMVKNDQKELDKLQQLRQWAFSAAQNGDLDMAIAAITGNNVTQIKSAVARFTEIKRQHEMQLQQAEQMLKQQELQNELAKIQAKGEQDRQTEALKYQYELQLKSIDVDITAATPQADTTVKDNLAVQSELNKTMLAQTKLDLDRAKLQSDIYNKAADRQVKREDIESKERIAKMNKNKYDK